jgi:hypothetical protein
MFIEEIRRIDSSPREIRKFAWLVGGACVILGLYGLWRERSWAQIFLFAGSAVILLGLFSASSLKPVQRAWMAIAVIMGWVMTRVILAALFYLVVTPIGLLFRLSRKRFLDTAADPRAGSYWRNRRTGPPGKETYERQF